MYICHRVRFVEEERMISSVVSAGSCINSVVWEQVDVKRIDVLVDHRDVTTCLYTWLE